MNLPLQEPQTAIWIIDDDQSMRWVLEKTLSNNGYQVTAFESGSVALANFKRTLPQARPRLRVLTASNCSSRSKIFHRRHRLS
jgi:DNA-binding NtrC family response regulator